ncbi:hypothetical protein GWE18_34055, partial [Bradyrhizobium sp. CSA112]|nr:hypothetical protein [Bradyrhizobium sp. CSA112]
MRAMLQCSAHYPVPMIKARGGTLLWTGEAKAVARTRRWGNGPGLPSKQAALATALLNARFARLAWKAGGRPSHGWCYG